MQSKKIICAAALTFLLTGCGIIENRNIFQTPEPTLMPTPIQTPVPTPSPTPIPLIVISFGEMFTLGDWEITLDSVVTKSKIQQNNITFDAGEGNKYIVAEVTVKNIAKKAATFIPSFYTETDAKATIIYKNSYEYSPIALLGHDDNLCSTYLSPLASKTGVIVFTAPLEVTEPGAEFSLKFESNERTARIRLAMPE